MTRQEAIKLLCVEKSIIIEVDGNKGAEKMLQAYDMAIKALSTEPKTGHWISDNLVGWKCSECGRHIVLNIEVGNYCPNCGAKMRGLEE